MIRFGPAGIPLSCKGRTLRDGVEDVHGLSLTAMEIQMVRAETLVFYPEEEEIGLTMKDIDMIRATITNSLAGVYHDRVEYPKLKIGSGKYTEDKQ